MHRPVPSARQRDNPRARERPALKLSLLERQIRLCLSPYDQGWAVQRGQRRRRQSFGRRGQPHQRRLAVCHGSDCLATGTKH